ncbi:NIPSNAP family protein [Noviherbaspirillum sp.]|uniref:NIPSNAP family protein n=1 Tax=Noviherbaspirillum sp. TaxID=1926288 RepID=UPI002B4875FE|nr:NIPSNAP family protein [Noviherbaspirillum sp.]HJV79996.1 NIPSNAP family protein [Noviherbaspirillum sp.]
MLVEQRTYAFQVGAVPKFLELYERHGMALQKKILGNLIGYFTTEIGGLNQVVHLWGYESLDDRDRRRAELLANKEWQAFFMMVVPLLVTQENKILKPTTFSPIQ